MNYSLHSSPRSRRRLDGRSSGAGPAGMRRAAALRPLCALAALLAWSAISNFNNEYARLKAGLIGKSWPTRFEKEQTFVCIRLHQYRSVQRNIYFAACSFAVRKKEDIVLRRKKKYDIVAVFSGRRPRTAGPTRCGPSGATAWASPAGAWALVHQG